ncbi:MAG: hypothetical protein ABII00_10415 [Elusimicrobiota bacterium]
MANMMLAAGACGLALSIGALASGAPWIRQFFYLPVWWSYLMLVGGANRRLAGAASTPAGAPCRTPSDSALAAGARPAEGAPSWIADRPGTYARMALFSVPAWLIYEALNLRLANWEYWELPEPLWIRWPGYVLAFATVLPAILETAAFCATLLRRGVDPGRGAVPDAVSDVTLKASFCLGVVCLALPMLWPRLFFGLVWAPAFLMIEPWLARRRPRRSWLASLSAGKARDLSALLLSGLICGLLWESLNFWAGAKWKYTVPWPKGPKLFEMPLLGYLGFLPFALGCSSLWHFFETRWETAAPAARVAAAAALGALSLLALWAIDARTVRSLVPLARLFGTI